MQQPGKILVVSQHYPPDATTTATYVGAIAQALAADHRVVVLSGSEPAGATVGANPEIVAVPGWYAPKQAVVRRAVAISLLALRMALATFRRAARQDVVFCVTTPFTLPYAVVLAARLRGAAVVLLIYDLYPEALIAAGLTGPLSLLARLLRLANAWMFPALTAIVTIGRDVAPLLANYDRVAPQRVHFIPNWALLPIGYRPLDLANRFRPRQAELVVGLSGNLGFTHDPRSVFDAARILRENGAVHFLLSGWGAGFAELERLQAAQRLGNTTLLPPVADADLVEFLSAADIWVIPYRRGIAGVSIPSRLYNLLAVGRAIVVAAEPHSEAALVVAEEDAGWVVPPEDASGLAEVIRRAAADLAATRDKGRRAAAAAETYRADAAISRYRDVIANAMNGPRA